MIYRMSGYDVYFLRIVEKYTNDKVNIYNNNNNARFKVRLEDILRTRRPNWMK